MKRAGVVVGLLALSACGRAQSPECQGVPVRSLGIRDLGPWGPHEVLCPEDRCNTQPADTPDCKTGRSEFPRGCYFFLPGKKACSCAAGNRRTLPVRSPLGPALPSRHGPGSPYVPGGPAAEIVCED
jgi:hypothetical protein